MTHHQLFLKHRRTVDYLLEHGLKLREFFKKYNDLDDLAVKCLLWGHIFMPEYLPTKSPEFHYDMAKWFFSNKNEYSALPRGHGKTTIIQVCISFSVANGLDKFIVLIEKTFNEASEVLESIRDLYKHSQTIKSVYGELVAMSPSGERGNRVKDSVGDFFINGVRLRGLGFNKSIRGLKSRESRPTRIVLDDVESDEHIENPEQRRKYLDNYLKGIIPASESTAGNIKIYGTILHDDSLLKTLIENHEGRVFGAWDEKKELLWPDFWTPEKLEQKRKEMSIGGRSDAAFYQEFFNEPVSEEDQIFRKNMFRYYSDKELEAIKEGQHTTYVLLDPAISKQTSADYTALVAVVVDRMHNLYIGEIIRERLSPAETIKALFAMYERWHPQKVGIEVVAYQKSLVYQINELKLKENSIVRAMQIHEIYGNTANNKFEKIKSLQPKYEMGQVYHRSNDPMTKILESELLRFPRAATDDVTDALAGIMQIASPVKRPTQNRYAHLRRYQSHRQIAY